ncbi:hypothetical protein [Pseudooceanicola spongiae]|jgi:predicted GNAT superfamily acetyltransferase|nr:hypothetical protein [Pseudooceanicola spongiae]|tara:strand:- start:414 stop:557 length:144 start_codon:yes stop_codon:yes gene_type:complete
MSNKTAILLGGVILAALVADAQLAGGAYTLFLLRKFSDFLEWIAFWR